MPVEEDYTYSFSARTEKEEDERRQMEKELREIDERAVEYADGLLSALANES